MIKIPFIVITYGDTEAVKMFAYEKHGRLVLPLFNNGDFALRFIQEAKNISHRNLKVQVCNNAGSAKEMFRHILLTSIDKVVVAIDQPDLDLSDISCIALEDCLLYVSGLCSSPNI